MSIIDSMKTFLQQNHVSLDIQESFYLYEKIRGFTLIDDIYEELRIWISKVFKIKNFKIILSSKNKNDLIFHNGKEFNLEDELTQNFTIDINDESTIMFLLLCENHEHYNDVEKKYLHLNILFYIITPLIEKAILSDILKDNLLKDPTTGLYNRTYLLKHLDKMLPLARREQKNVAFLKVGIDHFKAVMEEFDYNISDKVLIELANTLQNTVRESDIVVRLDSDEFLVVLSNIQDGQSAINVAKKLIKNFSLCEVDVNSYTGQTLKKTICVGISMYPEDSTSIDQILRNTDISLSEAKNIGRSQVLKFEKEQETSIDLF